MGWVVGCLGALAGLSAAAPCGAEAPPPTLRVPPGFEVDVFHPGVGRARHIETTPAGDLFVRLREPSDGGAIVALRDTDGVGRADREERFAADGGTGIRWRDGYLYYSTPYSVLRVPLASGALRPAEAAEPEPVVEGFPEQRGHLAKSLDFDAAGRLYVNSGAPSNSCQKKTRSRGSPGLPDCPQLERQAGIWRFPAGAKGKQQQDGERFATGLRNCVALRYDPAGDALHVVMHGRDQLRKLWPGLYDVDASANLPAEEMHRLEAGSNAGWPYTYWDGRRQRRIVSPEYGGDGHRGPKPGLYQDPEVVFPAHWAPNALLFLRGESWPARFRGGAFVAFHGSWNRGGLGQEGFLVAFVPFHAGRPSGRWEVFADGFAGEDFVKDAGDARARPTGLAEGPDGSLYVADSRRGTIWRIRPPRGGSGEPDARRSAGGSSR